MSAVEQAEQRPAEIQVMTGGRFVVLIVDPETAETLAAEHELGAHMGIYDESQRPGWRSEADRIAAAARAARTGAPAPLGIENAIPLQAMVEQLAYPRLYVVGTDIEVQS